MFKNVLVPVDFSENSRAALRSVKEIPGIRKIVLLHVIYNRYPSGDKSVDDPALREAGKTLEEMKDLVASPGVPVTHVVREISGGEISDAITRVARELDISVIVMSRRGEGIIGTLLLGSVASDLVRYGDINLLLLPPARVSGTEHGSIPAAALPATIPTGLLRRVMVCTDFSDPEIGELCLGFLPGIDRASLFHAVTRGNSAEEVEERVVTASARLGELQAAFIRTGIMADYKVVVGSAAEEILAFSEQEDISLILLKSRGRKSLINSLIGSTSAPVARNAKKPVLILKPPFRLGY
jgi:nucleotide-binding universal stress UspA family protein